MTEPAAAPLPACFRRYPGAVLQCSPEGVVLGSNGRLERELGMELVGRPFAAVLDADSCADKWARILVEAPAATDGEDQVWELVLRGSGTLPEPRSFSALWDADSGSLWVLEHPRDPRMDGLREQVTEVNSELANTQRDLVKERGRLARALEELEEQYRVVSRLARTVREQNEELERSNQALDDFAHVVSHDLKAPLRSIATYADWLEDDHADALPEAGREQLARLRSRVQRMRAMIDGVLEFARAGRSRQRPEPLDVERLLREVVEMLAPPPEVRVEIEPGMPTLVSERAPLFQLFLNLIGNAVRYARRPEGRVRVEVREAGEFVEFSVSDNGSGIPRRHHQRIWGLFDTLEPEERTEGTGIGLAVVKKLVEGAGGRVWVESEEGEGATFRFLWPRERGEHVEAAEP